MNAVTTTLIETIGGAGYAVAIAADSNGLWLRRAKARYQMGALVLPCRPMTRFSLYGAARQ